MSANPYVSKLKKQELPTYTKFESELKTVQASTLYTKYFKPKAQSLQLTLAFLYLRPCLLPFVKDIYKITNEEILSLKIIDYDPMFIRWLSSPNKKVQMAAVIKNPKAIMWIESAHEDVQMYVVKKDPMLVTIITDPDTDVVLTAVAKNPLVLDKLKSPTDYVEAVSKMAGIPQVKDAWKTITLAKAALLAKLKNKQKIVF